MGGASAVTFGLATSVGAGTADYLAKTTTDRVGPLSSLWFLEAFGAPILVALALVFEGNARPPAWAAIGLVGLSTGSVVGLFFLYRAFALGRLSVVAPLTSGYPALTTTLSVIFLGERFDPVQIAGLVSTLTGILILSTGYERGPTALRSPRRGVASALVAFLAFGIFYFGLKLVVGPVPPFTAAAVTRLVGVACVLPVLLRSGGARWPTRSLWGRATAFPVLDSLSLVTFNLGVALSASISVLTTVSGLYGAVTLLWAIVLLRERPGRWQWAGCGTIFLGVALLAIA